MLFALGRDRSARAPRASAPRLRNGFSTRRRSRRRGRSPATACAARTTAANVGVDGLPDSASISGTSAGSRSADCLRQQAPLESLFGGAARFLETVVQLRGPRFRHGRHAFPRGAGLGKPIDDVVAGSASTGCTRHAVGLFLFERAALAFRVGAGGFVGGEALADDFRRAFEVGLMCPGCRRRRATPPMPRGAA